MKKNNKGFTLIELLAVIVILAILILAVMPQVLTMMEKARQNSFKVEAQEFLNTAETAYTDKSLNNTGDVTIKTVTIDSVQYRYLCMTLSNMVNEGYAKKTLTNYSGVVEVFVPPKGNAIYGINISNGSYVINYGTLDLMASDNYQVGVGTGTTNECSTANPPVIIHEPKDYIAGKDV